jgi:hypothetical protein
VIEAKDLPGTIVKAGTWSGCRLAVDEFFARPENADQFEWLRNRTRLHIRRIEDADDPHVRASNVDQRDDR